MSDGHDDFADAVLEVVDDIPPGRVMTYGDIAEFLQRGGPRGVGGVMARDGAAVTWWRVVRANGTLPPHLMIEAQTQWLYEGTPLRRGIVDVAAARWWPD
ncbi:MGMT family protein [Mycolicibacterium grossiae]|uniref:Cysteine methyltransferase n=1 Tax=Mycolicibacterium grossiae TaxID=1552759 RepID=A0A1E8Q578_9MYCO|nr:MGMT family protein [Mycolicibacterium grossiae]OFJ53034.1 cysteine methyltransferase [Mycolicibacterium grossiae]QEM46919.1 cysteine methyltransferase [Mycolicibacterium grossiae]